jgi:N-acetylglucosaminyldiphosphoundecaprenol N-acetyl-beta-D-mannosaminyltransferase
VRARDEADLNVAHHSSLVNAPDGVPLVWVARLLGLKRISRVCGPDMMLEVCRNGIDKGWRHVLFGSTPETLAKLKESLQRQFPSLQIVDAISPAFGVVSSEEREAQVDRIRRAQPHFVWVGLGSPKQEVWMAQNASSLPGSLCMGVGAAFDMHAGRIRRAPNWMRGIGVEWLYRITQDPSRLINRYAKVVPRFLALITVALAQHGFNNAKSRLFGARQAG